jgi:SAM-dependent methyltransferase
MMSRADHLSQKSYWEETGHHGCYVDTRFASSGVGAHIMGREWHTAMEIADRLGISRSGRVLDVGCGDGSFSNRILAQNFESVQGVDFSEASIKRARGEAAPHVSFQLMDLVVQDLNELGSFEGAFLLGFLHHIKKSAAATIRALGAVTDKVVLLEPNGAHLARKLLELAPSYIAAGEGSFRHSQLVAIFEEAGFQVVVHRRFNVFPNMTPMWAFKLLKPIEPFVEGTPIVRGLCTVNAYGLRRSTAASAAQ